LAAGSRCMDVFFQNRPKQTAISPGKRACRLEYFWIYASSPSHSPTSALVTISRLVVTNPVLAWRLQANVLIDGQALAEIYRRASLG
jgi:hypothetical protein